MKIKSVKAIEILDSRGVPTISTRLEFEDGNFGYGDVPSGASTGATEVVELRDGDPDRYFGKGTLKALHMVNTTIANELIGKKFNDVRELDEFLIELDGTEQKSKLGGNSILSISMAFCNAHAKSLNLELYEYFGMLFWGEGYDKTKLELPQPQILLMEGGKHGNWATDFQEYFVIPKMEKFENFAEMLRAGAEIFKATHDILVEKGYAATVGFEGAFAPQEIKSNPEAFEIMLKGVEKAGYKPGEDIILGIDAAASEFYDEEKKLYVLKRENKSLNQEEWLSLQTEWYEKYPIWTIEDTMDEEDWEGWQKLVTRMGDKLQIVGDDLLTTNVKRIQKAIDLNAVNSVLIKINQIGTISETIDAIKLSDEAGYSTVISHRGGETNSSLIADLVVGTSSWQSKFGGPDRGERLAKYNRLLEIESLLGE